MKLFEGSYRFATIVAAVHFVGASTTAWYVSVLEQTDGQAVLLWAHWTIIDFPVSFLSYFLIEGQYFVAHALVGTLWWFFIVTVFTRIVQAIRSRSRASGNQD